MTLWRDKLHETFHSVTYPATAKIDARQVARKVELNFTFGNGSCNLSRNDYFLSLQGMLHCEMFRATSPTTMSPRHCETSCTNISQYNSTLKRLLSIMTLSTFLLFPANNVERCPAFHPLFLLSQTYLLKCNFVKEGGGNSLRMCPNTCKHV